MGFSLLVVERGMEGFERGRKLDKIGLDAQDTAELSFTDVKVPVDWWHGDADHIVPFTHGEHCVSRLPDATLHVMEGESHLGGLGMAEEVLHQLA